MIKVEKRKSVWNSVIVPTHTIQFNPYLFKEGVCDQNYLRASPRCKFGFLFVILAFLTMIANSIV